MAHQTDATNQHQRRSTSFLRRTAWMLAFGVAGLVGVAATTALQLTLDPSLAARSGLPADASILVATALSIVTPAVLVVVATTVGTATAPRVGFRSFVHEYATDGRPVWRRLRESAPKAVLVGLATGAGILALDVVLTRVAPAAAPTEPGPGSVGFVLASAPARFLFGGLAEELMLRWGLVSAIAWLLGAVVSGDRSRTVAWAAVVLAAIAFGAAHLPQAAASVELTLPVVARIVALNAMAGVVFGWLYVTDALETAMLAHASAHIVLIASAIVTVV
jgi:membrane protease YdiL (CAAX protease family)